MESGERNGNVAEQDRGIGSGATWNCAEDADIADDAADCLQDWDWGRGRGRGPGWGASLDGARYEAVVFQDDGQSGRVALDVTEAVRSGVHAWTLQRARGRGSLTFVSGEGAEALGDPGLAPTLILTRPVEEDVSSIE